MQYAMLGNTGLVVSRMAFGAMTFTAGNKNIAAIYKVGAGLADELVGRALEAGINFFDTADGYAGGESEQLLGKALKPRRSEVVIATKVGFRSGAPLTQAGLSRRHILWSVDQSLKRLGTDWIDVYIAHKEDPCTPLEETLQAFDEVVRAGKARYLGFSNWSAWKAAAALELQKAHGWAPFTHGQMNYSLVGRDVERDLIPMMRRYGLGLTVWSPLASGFLSGNKEQGFALVEKMRPMAKRAGGSVAQVALAWLLSKKAVTSIILGATKLQQLEDNLAAVRLKLTAEELAALDEATTPPKVYPTWFIEQLVDGELRKALG